MQSDDYYRGDIATLSVTAVNDDPVLTQNDTAPIGYTRNSQPGVQFVLASSLATTLADVDSPNFDTGVLTVHIASGGHAGDRLKPSGNYSFSGSNFLYFSTVIGTVDSDGTDADLKIAFNANATRAIVEGLINSLRFRTVGGVSGQRNIEVSLTDGDGGTSNTLTRTVVVS